jgi:beta-glucosidase-like glycosyl hydrolase
VKRILRYCGAALAAGAGILILGLPLSPVLAQRPLPPEAPKGPWMDATIPPDQRADLVMRQMTLDEKITLVHGTGGFAQAGPRSNGGAGVVAGIPRLGLPDLQLADSAVGVRAAAGRGRYSTLLPSTICEAASWDPKIAFQFGELIGRELRDQQYNVSLGGGMDIMREPRNGRNFEYLGEDPVLAGKMAARFIEGMQSQKVIGDVKHFAFNDQETGRSIGNVRLDTRAMRETDLLAFEIAVTEGYPGMVMCSYNKLNGDWACENGYLLNDVLKKAWGFQGFVLSDWGGTHSTAKAALAGLDNEEPGGRYFGEELKKAVQSGEVPMARLDDMVHRILRTEFALGIIDDPPEGRVVDPFKGADTAQFVAEQGIVLLKNERGILPLNASAVKSILLVGSHADTSVLSGGGSAQVDPPGSKPIRDDGTPIWFPSSPLKAIRAKAAKARVDYLDGSDPAAAAAAAKNAETAIVFVHQPTHEGVDLPTLTLPNHQGRTGQSGSGGEPAHDRGARNRRTRGHALDQRSGGRDRGLVSRNPRRGSTGEYSLRRCQSVRQASGFIRQVRPRPSSSQGPGNGTAAASIAGRTARPHSSIRDRLQRRPRGRVQVVPGGTQGAALCFRGWPFLHHLYLLWARSRHGRRDFHSAQHRQAGRRGNRPGIRGLAAGGSRTAQAPGGVDQNPARPRRIENRNPPPEAETVVHFRCGEERLAAALRRIPFLCRRIVAKHASDRGGVIPVVIRHRRRADYSSGRYP